VNDKNNVLIVDGMSALQCNAVCVFVVLLEGVIFAVPQRKRCTYF